MNPLQVGVLVFVFIGGIGLSVKNNTQENIVNDLPTKTINETQVKNESIKRIKNEWNTDTVIMFGNHNFEVETAETIFQKTKGLSNRKTFPKNHAMLFTFLEPGKNGFWMKDMYVSIDIVWLDEHKKVIHVEEKVAPDTFPQVFGNDKDSKYVLEFDEGTAEKIGIKIGSKFDF